MIPVSPGGLVTQGVSHDVELFHDPFARYDGNLRWFRRGDVAVVIRTDVVLDGSWAMLLTSDGRLGWTRAAWLRPA